MTKQQRKRKMLKHRQEVLRRRMLKEMFVNGLIVVITMFISLNVAISNMQPIADESDSSIDYHLIEGSNSIPNKEQNESIGVEEKEYPMFTYSKDWDANDSYLLAKIAMCEAGNQNTETKALVIMTILNRVWDDYFPDTIEEVIFQKGSNGVYQFSPIGDGSWERNEPDEDCYKALDLVIDSIYDVSEGALYFESCKDQDNWHSSNLEFVYQSESIRFYK